MWLFFLLLTPQQIEVKTEQSDVQLTKEYHQKGPDYAERFKFYENKFDFRKNDFLRQTNDFLIDSTIYFAPAVNKQSLPQATYDGTNYFVIWADERRAQPGDAKEDVYGTRVSPSGEILDKNGIFIGATQSAGNVYIGMFPAVAYGAGVYLCIYEDYDWVYETWDLWGVRVDTAGNVLDPGRIQITNRPTYEGMAQVAFDGMNFLVVWMDYTPSTFNQDIYGARVTPEGVVLDPNGFPIHATTSYKTIYSDVAFDGTNYMVVWTDERTPSWSIYFARVTPDAVVLDPAGFPICDLEAANANMPKITYGANNYFIIWNDCRDEWLKPYGARVTPQGQVLDPDGFSIAPTIAYAGKLPSVTFDGLNYFVTFVDQDYGCYGARVSPEGFVIDSTRITIETPYGAYTTDVTSDGTNSFALWSAGKYSDRDIFGARIDQQGNVLDPNGFIVSLQTNTQIISAVSFDQQNYFVIWSEKRNTEDIYGKFVSPSSGPIDSLIQISSRNWIEDWPSVAFGDSDYMVVWHGNFSTWDIFGARVSTSGEVLDPGGITIGAWSGNQAYPSVSFGEENWLVVWDDSRNGAEDIYGTRVNSQGQILDPTHIPISTADNEQWFPSVSFDGTNYFVVWMDQRGLNFDIYGARVDAGGNVLDPNGIIISSADVHQYYPKVCFDGNNYFAVWMDWRNYGSTEWDIFGARLTPDGIVLDPSGIPICNYQYDQGMPDVAFDGENYIVLWEDWRSQETCDIYGAVVDTSGIVIDSFIVSNERIPEQYPTLAKGPFDYSLFTFTKHAPQPYDVFRIYGQYYPPVGIEESRILKPHTLNLQVFPNPFATSLQIAFQNQTELAVSVKIYDITGRLVKTLHNGAIHSSTLRWHGDDDCGRAVSQGIYFVQVKNLDSGETSMHKVLKVR
jgi:hypothetical protein